MTGGTVIGCVWGAHRALTEQMTAAGYPPPSYAWCEDQWATGPRPLRRTAPAGNALPLWLTGELWSRWRAEQAAGRPERYQQPALFGAAL